MSDPDETERLLNNVIVALTWIVGSNVNLDKILSKNLIFHLLLIDFLISDHCNILKFLILSHNFHYEYGLRYNEFVLFVPSQ